MLRSVEISSDFVIIGRHGHSTVNPGGGQPAFNYPGAVLTPDGIMQAHELADRLETDYGIVIAEVDVGVSGLFRTWQTAHEAGCPDDKIHGYDELNEVGFELGRDMDPKELRMIVRGYLPLPKKVRNAAKAAIDTFPEEPVIISSGLLIAGICIERKMDMSNFERPVPQCGEVRRIPRWRRKRTGATSIIDLGRAA